MSLRHRGNAGVSLTVKRQTLKMFHHWILRSFAFCCQRESSRRKFESVFLGGGGVAGGEAMPEAVKSVGRRSN